jgi:hypothetical protein
MQEQGTKYQPDLIVGILIIAFSACGACAGLGLAGLGGVLGAVGVTQITRGAGPNAEATAIAGASGLVAVIGMAIAILSLANIAGGVGVLKSKRWGFMLTAVLSGIGFLLSLSGSDGFLGSIPNLAAAIYCGLRHAGKLGPPAL